jgi:tetratricopeptide (TPR) repeat protein
MSDYFISRASAEGDLLAAAAYMAERIKSADGRAEAMKAVVPLYLARGEVDLAAELANAIDDPFSRDKLLTLVAEKCAEIDDDEYALQLAGSVEEHGMRAEAFERVALIRAGKGDFAKAAEIADTLAHPDFVYAGIAMKQAVDGDDAAAKATLERIEFAAARVSALQQTAAARLEGGKTEKAVSTLDDAVAAAADIEHDEEKIRALCDIGSLFIDATRNDKAIETFDQARALAEVLDNTHRDHFLVNCALGFMFAGSDELAESTLDLVPDKTQMASALLGMAREYWKREDKEDALDAIDEAYQILKSQRDIETRDSRARNGLMASIAAQFAGFGKTERAVEIARENQDPAEETNALSQIAQILTVQNEDELARQAIDSIADDADRVTTLISISDAKAKLEEKESAIARLDEAASLAETVPQLAARSNILALLASRFAGNDSPDKARNMSLENLQVISEIKDESSRAAALATLADLHQSIGFELSDQERAAVKSLTNQLD